MAIDVTKTLRQALAALEAEKARISRQIESIQQVLASGRLAPWQAKRGAQSTQKRHPMSAPARKAASQRMKAYWAKRRTQAKAKGTGDK